MGLSTALFTGVSGLLTISESLNVIGDNLANVNTPGFKSSTALFETVFSQTLSGATVPTANLLGTNPIQLGLGTKLSSIDRNFAQGSLNGTGNLGDFAVQGNGFFILSDGVGIAFTRDGSFGLSVDGILVDPATGLRVQGWQAVDGVVTPMGSVGDIMIPIGVSIVQETSNALFSGNFNASGAEATTGNVLLGPTMGAVTAVTELDTLGLDLDAGDVITISGRKGGADISFTFDVTDTTTLGDLADAIEAGFGIADGAITGGGDVIITAGGEIQIQSDLGTGNAISDVLLTATDAVAFDAMYNPGGLSAFTETTPADGESFMLSGLNVFDSLGNSIPLNITFTRTGPNELQYLAESPLGTTVGSGTLSYDFDGQFLSADNNLISIDLGGTGATSPLSISLDFANTTFLSGDNTFAMSSQDGFPIGSLEQFFVGLNGIVTGSYTNGLSRTIGQVALAAFANQQGLMAIGDNLYLPSGNSGEPIVGVAGTGSRGTMVQGFLEGSNTDMATEFTNIIIAQRGFQANARTITTADMLMEEVISLVR
jgi:flagellar hook protein FlgE